MLHELLSEAAALRKAGRLEEAAALLRAALVEAPDSAHACTQLGTLLGQLGQVHEAKDLLSRAVTLSPEDPFAHMNLANALRLSGGASEALRHYREAVRLKPDLVVAWSNLLRPMLDACDWTGATRGMEFILELRRQGDRNWASYIVPMTAILLPLSQALCREVAEYHAARIAVGAKPTAKVSAGPRHRLRVAYFSRDFRNHAVGQLARALFRGHDRSRFEVLAYSYGRDDGSVYRNEIEAAADRFLDVRSEAPAQTAARIARDAVDILVDLGGHTTDHRLAVLACRPAPVQCHYLGYPATLGGRLADFFITDAVASPPAQDAYFAEKLLRLPDCFMVSDPDQPLVAAPPSRDSVGLPERAIVLCAFHQTAKITEQVFAAWMQILAAVPQSILWLRQDNEDAMRNLAARAESDGIDPTRLVFAPPAKHKRDHVGRIAAADLFLDTFNRYNGHSTVNEALWSALPVVTLAGESFAARVAASLLTAAGFAELVTGSATEYVALAIGLAQDAEARASLRRRLHAARGAAALFDNAATVRSLESAYEDMWKAAQTR